MTLEQRITKGGRCPCCDSVLDGATRIDGGNHPSPGDFSICIYCATPLRFNDDLTIRALVPEDTEDIPEGFNDYLDMVKMIRFIGKKTPLIAPTGGRC